MPSGDCSWILQSRPFALIKIAVCLLCRSSTKRNHIGIKDLVVTIVQSLVDMYLTGTVLCHLFLLICHEGTG